MDAMSLADRSSPVRRLLIGGHTRIYRATNGLIGHRFPGGPPMLLLDQVGAETGSKRTTPLVYVNDRDVLIVQIGAGAAPPADRAAGSPVAAARGGTESGESSRGLVVLAREVTI